MDKKEIKEEKLKKIIGGSSKKMTCIECNASFYESELVIQDRWRCCPKCKKKILPIISAII